MSLHGPHHVAQKSTSTGRSACAQDALWLTPQPGLAFLRLNFGKASGSQDGLADLLPARLPCLRVCWRKQRSRT